MEPKEIVMAFYDALINDGPDEAAAYLADNFKTEAPNMPVQDKKGWLEGQRMWRAAFSDFSFKPEITGIDGDVVRVTSNVSGTHTGDINLEPFGMGLIEATGKAISISVPIEFVVEGDKITSSMSERGGPAAVLEQLGIDMP